MEIKILANGCDEFGHLSVECVSNPKSNPESRTVHFTVTDTTKWFWQDGYEKKYKRKVSKNKCFRFNGNTYNLSSVII